MKNNVVSDFFDNIDTRDKAYLLGFFAADGYVTQDCSNRKTPTYRIGIENSIDDIEVIEAFRAFICPSCNIITRSRDLRKDQVVLRWTDKHMFETLERIGLGQNKTQTFNFSLEYIPHHLRNDFVRGYFDGDGSFSDENVHICFNNKQFAEEILKWLKSEIPFIGGEVKEHKVIWSSYYTIRFNFEGQKLFGCYLLCRMFYRGTSLYLERKRKQFADYFKRLANMNWVQVIHTV